MTEFHLRGGSCPELNLHQLLFAHMQQIRCPNNTPRRRCLVELHLMMNEWKRHSCGCIRKASQGWDQILMIVLGQGLSLSCKESSGGMKAKK